jgi:hypothetical protein
MPPERVAHETSGAGDSSRADSGPFALDDAKPIGEPTDAELERGILDAVRLGLDDVARTLAAQLDDRRRSHIPHNVVDYSAERSRRRR